MKKIAFSLLLLFSPLSPSIASETRIKKAYVDQKNDVHVISPEGADKKITSSARAGRQTIDRWEDGYLAGSKLLDC